MSPHESSVYFEYFVMFLVGFQHCLFLVVVQSLSHVQLFVTPWTAAHQASLSLVVSQITQTHVHWVDDAIQPSVAPFSSCPQSFPVSVSWSFSFSNSSPSNEYSGLISFRTDWFDFLTVQGTLKNFPQFESISSSALSLLNGPILTSIHDYWKIMALTMACPIDRT